MNTSTSVTSPESATASQTLAKARKAPAKVALDASSIRAAIAANAGKRARLWDTKLKGFGIEISAGGKVSFLVSGRVGGKAALNTLPNAPFPHPTYTVADARAAAKQALARFALGETPFKPVRVEVRDTLRTAAATYLTDYATYGSPEEVRNMRLTFEGKLVAGKRVYRYKCIEALLDRDIRSITTPEARAVHKALYEEIRAGVDEPKPSFGGRTADCVVISWAGRIFKRATRDDTPVPPNPFVRVDKYVGKKAKFGAGNIKPRPATSAELDTLIARLNAWEGLPEQRAVCLLQLLCGWRRQRAQRLRWDYVSAEHITIPATDNKKTKREFALPITAELAAVLELCRSFGSEQWCTPQADRERPSNSDDWWQRWLKDTGMTSHNVRDTVATWVAVLNKNPVAGDTIIDHVQKTSGVSDRYQGFDDWKREWLQKWHDELVRRGLRMS